MVFSVYLNTHSVDLSYDFKEIINAEDDQNNVYEAIGWTGRKGGHHLRGQIEFEPISQNAQKILLVIEGIDGQKEVFEWSLK